MATTLERESVDNDLVDLFGSQAVITQRPLEPFQDWLEKKRPKFIWNAPHFRAMQAVLARVTAGEIRRAYFQLPIRHGKTEHNTISYAAYRIEHDHAFRVLVTSYNEKRAKKFSRAIRKLVRSLGVPLSEERAAAGEWETLAGGGVEAIGAGAGVASVNADLIIVDDPIGKREDAESQAKRDMLWDWLTNDILARCDPTTAVIMTMSRWHVDDPAGRLQDQMPDQWTILDRPGEAEKNDPLGRKIGEPLWPELRGKAWLDEKRIELREYGFASLVQGRPRPREGSMFKWDWWKLMEEIPRVGYLVRYWDLAGTEAKGKGHDPDYTAGALALRMQDLRTAFVDVARFRKSVAQRDADMERICKEDLQRFRGRIRWWIETEAGIEGERRTKELVRKLQALGMPVSTEHPTGNKIYRAEPLASKAEAGNVVLAGCTRAPDGSLVPASWMNEFRNEAADFPNGKHDDQIDSAAGADSKLADTPGSWGTSTWKM
jgi:predicted phage terminase large subunit-like protein